MTAVPAVPSPRIDPSAQFAGASGGALIVTTIALVWPAWAAQGAVAVAIVGATLAFLTRRRSPSVVVASTETCTATEPASTPTKAPTVPNLVAPPILLPSLLGAHPAGANVLVVAIRLERVAEVESGLGRPAAETMLADVETRLLGALRQGDHVGRLDRTTFLVSCVASPGDDGAVLIERLEELVTRPMVVEGQAVALNVRIGVVLNAGKYGTDDAVFRAATTALNAVPTRGRKKLQVYRTAMLEQAALGLRLEAELGRAVERGEIVVHYQPIISMVSRELVAFEALVRWVRRSGGVVSPLDFIPAAESSGSIVPIGREVLRQSCESLAAWRRSGQCGRDVAIAVNVSAVQFEHGSLYDDVIAALTDAELPPSCLKIEVTESVMMEDLAAHARTLQRLRDAGVRVAMDDFGTGHSSLAYLQQLPIDVLKVDRSFVSKMHSDAESAQIVRTVLELARGLGLRVVAEGVETERDFTTLAAQGCDDAQGYFFSRPLSADAALAFLRDWREGATSGQRALADTSSSPLSERTGASGLGRK